MTTSSKLLTIENKLKSPFKIISGGMGVAVSNWILANKVSSMGGLGVVSGVGLDSVLIRRLQNGDLEGHMKRAMEKFPFPEIAERVYDKYFIEGGKLLSESYKLSGLFTINSPDHLLQLTTLANFVEVFLAKEGHNQPVGINYLEKIQLMQLPSIYGAMLAGVDNVLMGAGIPLQIPGILDSFSSHKAESYELTVENSSQGNKFFTHFDPKKIFGSLHGSLKRPDFFGIISSNLLATILTTKASGKVNGFIVEGTTAGGHNAPPRRKNIFNELGEPIYGKKDEVNLIKLADLGLPFWLAGGYDTPEKLTSALDDGAQGIQVGSLFSLTNESGYSTDYKQKLINGIVDGTISIYTDPVASPTGFPFKVLSVDNTLSKKEIYNQRPRICDLGYLRVPFEKQNGSLSYRCPAEPIENYLKKDGSIETTFDRKCLCNALMSNVNLAQIQKSGFVEFPMFTAGDGILQLKNMLGTTKKSYSVSDVFEYLNK